MSVFLLCEQAIGLVRGKRLILFTAERTMLENLNYEGLRAAHSQDEAVVCALHFARVRDRLLQSYAWAFAKKSATLANGATLPGDYLSMLYVLVNGDPVDYEVNGSYINVKSSSEIHYIAKITDTTKWASIFSDVFCYSLAIEICTAVTGKPEYTQVLEQKAQELIHRAFQIGAIKAEPIDFEEVGTVLYFKVATPTIRYTAKITDMSSWSGAFTDVFVSSLAQEIVLATTHNLDTVQLLEQKTQILIRNAEKLGAIKAEVKIPVTHDLYQRAILLARECRHNI